MSPILRKCHSVAELLENSRTPASRIGSRSVKQKYKQCIFYKLLFSGPKAGLMVSNRIRSHAECFVHSFSWRTGQSRASNETVHTPWCHQRKGLYDCIRPTGMLRFLRMAPLGPTMSTPNRFQTEKSL